MTGKHMTAFRLFRRMMQERRQYPRESMDWNYRTRAARKYLWIMWDVPVTEWPQ